VAQHGVPAAELTREKAALLSHLAHEAASESAQSSQAYAGTYVDQFLTGEGLLLDARQELAFAREMLPAITPAVMAQAGRVWRTETGRRVHVQLPMFAHVRPPTRASVLALFDSVQHTALPPETETTLAASPLLDHLPTPGAITAEQRDSVAGITEWTLSNGARVLVKPTGNDPDELLMRAWSPGGFSVMPDSLFFTPGRMVAKLMTEAAGLGTHDRASLDQQLATTGVRDLQVHIGYADESIDLDGSPKQLETLFQMLYLQFTAPKLDTAVLHSWASLAKYQGSGFSLNDQFNQLFARGEPRLLPVSTQLAELLDVKQAMAVYQNRFGNAGDFTFTLVGAITPAEVRPLVERYIASLPATAAREHAKPVDARPFADRMENRSVGPDLPRAQTLWAFDGLFPSDPAPYLRERQKLDVLATVVQDRLRVRLREQLGGTYSPSFTAFTYALPEEHYRAFLSFDAAPERMAAMNRETQLILDTVRTRGASAEEVARALTIERRQHETALQSNAFWLNTIGTYERLGIPLDKIPDPYDHQQVTPAELETAAQTYLPSDVYVHLTMMPQDSTLYTQRDTASAPAPRVIRARGP
jgi:zinc protease